MVTRWKNTIRKGRTYDVLYSPYREKAEMVQKILGKSDISKKRKKKKHVWLSGRLRIEGRLTKGRGFNEGHKDENEAKQNKRNTRERRHDICKPNARRAQVRATCGQSTRASEPARARLLWDILSLVLPVTFGHTIAYGIYSNSLLRLF